MRRRALVVDDDKLVAVLVRGVLASADFEVELAHDAAAASEALADFDPDVAILDISLGRGPSGIDLAHLAHRAYPAVALLLLTRYPDLRTAQAAVAEVPAGCGFLNKDSVGQPDVLLDAVEQVLHDNPAARSQQDGPLAGLTSTQLTVLNMAAQGWTSAEIARRRGCSPSAVEKILGSIYQRLNIRSDGTIHPRVEAIRIYAAAAVLPERAE